MTIPLPDKAEIARDFPGGLHIGTFGRLARFDAHLDSAGVSLLLQSPGDTDTGKSVHLHVRFELFADILRELANQLPGSPSAADCRDLREAARVLYHALAAASGASEPPQMTEEEGELILRLME